MNIIIHTLKKYISQKDTRFVFPSQLVADLWAEKTCALGIARSIAGNRFLAWDQFKKEAVDKQNREPVTEIMRKLFAEFLTQKNAKAAQSSRKGGGFLKSVIPAEYAGGGTVFAPFIAKLLPPLASWEKLTKNAGARMTPDPEDEDFTLIKKEYQMFLDRFNLFEPSWEEISVTESGVRYLLFFPELIEDFSEYDSILHGPRFIRIPLDMAEDNGQTLLRFRSVREEIRGAVLEIRSLHEEQGVPYEDMAVSVPGLEDMENSLLKEFHLHQVPVVRRAGKPLGQTGAGRFFRLVNDWALSRYSFNSVKALVLNEHIPWREPEKNRELIKFGIDYNCVSGYTKDGKIVDIWEEAFAAIHSGKYRELKTYYYKLKEKLSALSASKTFGELRENYFIFRNAAATGQNGPGGFLDMSSISAKDNAVLGRCIEELTSLVELEERFGDPAFTPASPCAFLVSCLDEKEYVPANQNPGVNIFKWRVAAAAPFRFHVVLNASQNAATVLYRPMGFLRQDKRKALGLEDQDATGAFFKLCHSGDDGNFKTNVRISASVQTFSGWAIPHSFFAQGKTICDPACSPGPYENERRFWRDPAGGAGPGKIYDLQQKSFNSWKEVLLLKKNFFTFFSAPFPAENPAAELLQNAFPYHEKVLSVTPTNDLNVFYECPLKWLFARILKAEEFLLEAALLDDIAQGILYHTILEVLFRKIRDEDTAFDSARLGVYKKWAKEVTEIIIKNEPAFRGPLAVPLVSPQAAGMSKKINSLLENETKYFNRFGIEELEMSISYQTGDLLIKERIDRVSLSPDGEPVIIDYKTNTLPDQTEPGQISETALSDFQMPLYIKLYEEKTKEKSGGTFLPVKGGYYYSIREKKYKAVVGEKNRSNSKTLDREEYSVILEAAEQQIEGFGHKVKTMNFVPLEIRIKNCLGCVYKTICRSVFFNAGT